MEEYAFYLEYDGKRTYRLQDGDSITILAGSIEQAIKKFAKRQQVVLETMDEIGDAQYRLFFLKKGWFRTTNEQLIYYVQSNSSPINNTF